MSKYYDIITDTVDEEMYVIGIRCKKLLVF